MKRIAIITIAMSLLAACAREPIKGEVTSKTEAGGRCYIEIQIEVDPFDYIGLDIGDEFEINK